MLHCRQHMKADKSLKNGNYGNENLALAIRLVFFALLAIHGIERNPGPGSHEGALSRHTELQDKMLLSTDDANKFDISHIISSTMEGYALGEVYAGTWGRCGYDKPCLVAIKLAKLYSQNISKARKLRKLSFHPCLLKIVCADSFCASSGNPQIYIAMEYYFSIAMDKYLSSRVEKGSPLLSWERIFYAKQLVYGISLLHSNGIFHGNLKSKYVLISPDGKSLKISDFGLSVAPQVNQMHGQKYDIYSLGLLYRALWVHDSTSPELRLGFSVGHQIQAANSLLRKMLDNEAEARPDADQVLWGLPQGVPDCPQAEQTTSQQQYVESVEALNLSSPYHLPGSKYKPVLGHYGNVTEHSPTPLEKEIKKRGESLLKLDDRTGYFPEKSLCHYSPVHSGVLYTGPDCEQVAVKFIKSRKGFEKQEIDILKNLQHENIVRYLSAGKNFSKEKALGRWYVITELCYEKSFNDLSKQTIKWIDLKMVLRHLAKGLRYMHERTPQVLHRDLKPDNILLSLDGKYAKLADFGYSKEILEAVTQQTSDRAGSKGYRSPESYVKGFKISERSDIYQLGLVYFYILTKGKHIFGDMQHWEHYIYQNDLKIKEKHLPSIKCGDAGCINAMLNDRQVERSELSCIECDDKELAMDLVLSMLRGNPYQKELTLEEEAGLGKELLEQRKLMSPEQQFYDSLPRPSAREVLCHPFFWTSEERKYFKCKIPKCLPEGHLKVSNELLDDGDCVTDAFWTALYNRELMSKPSEVETFFPKCCTENRLKHMSEVM